LLGPVPDRSRVVARKAREVGNRERLAALSLAGPGLEDADLAVDLLPLGDDDDIGRVPRAFLELKRRQVEREGGRHREGERQEHGHGRATQSDGSHRPLFGKGDVSHVSNGSESGVERLLRGDGDGKGRPFPLEFAPTRRDFVSRASTRLEIGAATRSRAHSSPRRRLHPSPRLTSRSLPRDHRAVVATSLWSSARSFSSSTLTLDATGVVASALLLASSQSVERK